MVALHRIEKMVSEYFSELYYVICAKSIVAVQCTLTQIFSNVMCSGDTMLCDNLNKILASSVNLCENKVLWVTKCWMKRTG